MTLAIQSAIDQEPDRPNAPPCAKATKLKSRSTVDQSASTTRQAPKQLRTRAKALKSLSETTFAKTFTQIDGTAKGLIADAIKCSGNIRRAAARIVIEGVRLFEASKSAPNEWANLINRELTDRGIKVNRGANFEFRVVANLLFRDLTKSKNDASLMDSKISPGQMTRYAQAMAWVYTKRKPGIDLSTHADDIIKLGGVRKAADLWSSAQQSLKERVVSTAGILPQDVRDGLESIAMPAERRTPDSISLPIVGIAKLEKAITTPMACLIYPDGLVCLAPLGPEAMSSTVTEWEAMAHLPALAEEDVA